MQLKHWNYLVYKTGAMDLFNDDTEDDIMIKILEATSRQDQASHAAHDTSDPKNIVKNRRLLITIFQNNIGNGSAP